MDPIAQYKGTTRKINCTFAVPADSLSNAIEHHEKFAKLMQMMYPNYIANTFKGVYEIAAPPLMRVKMANLIKDANSGNLGLLGYIPGIKYDPDINSPIFMLEQRAGSVTNIGYQSFKISFELNVLHSHKLGFDSLTDKAKAKGKFIFGDKDDENNLVDFPGGILGS